LYKLQILEHNDQEKICADGNDFCMTLSNSGNDVRSYFLITFFCKKSILEIVLWEKPVLAMVAETI
jgi:hypothetical protein